MAKLLCSAEEIKFTIMPYLLGGSLQQELIANPSDYVLGYIMINSTGKYEFKYTESGTATQANNHWSLNIVKKLPYSESEFSWIVYNCSPEKTRLEFDKILKDCGESLHIHNWDTWSVEGKESKVAVVTSWEIY